MSGASSLGPVRADIIVLGAGVAGLSLASELSPHTRVVLLEAESAPGFHASGRSATLAHFGVGTPPVRLLTRMSRRFFQNPPQAFCETPLSSGTLALFVARENDAAALKELSATMADFAPIADASFEEMRAAAPILRLGADGIVAGVFDPTAMRIDVDLLLQSYLRQIKRHGGETHFDKRVDRIERFASDWVVKAGDFACSAPVLVNATGAWGDRTAALAGVAPLGLRPLRRTIIIIDPPPEHDIREWPFVRTAVDEFVLLPQGGRLLASALDETPDDPGDAQPDEYDVALAAARVEVYTRLTVQRIAGRWAGLRTFASDRTPVAGFAEDAPGFFWFVGQGGYGVQTAPAMARAAASLIRGAAWPEDMNKEGVSPESLGPTRLSRAPLPVSAAS